MLDNNLKGNTLMYDITTKSRDEMIAELQKRECEVLFRKINGEERRMTCTLQESVLPSITADYQYPDPEKKPRPVNEANIVAWDVNANGFRTFRVENVVTFS